MATKNSKKAVTSNATILSKELKKLDIDLLKPDNYRDGKNPEALQVLADSIKSVGLLEPIGVNSNPDGSYTVIYGERRLLATSMTGATTIDAYVYHVDDTTRFAISMIENEVRKNTTEEEQVVGMVRMYLKMIEGRNHGQVVDMIATITGFPKMYVKKRCQLATLPPIVLNHYLAGNLRLDAAAMLSTQENTMILKIVDWKNATDEDVNNLTAWAIKNLISDQLNGTLADMDAVIWDMNTFKGSTGVTCAGCIFNGKENPLKENDLCGSPQCYQTKVNDTLIELAKKHKVKKDDMISMEPSSEDMPCPNAALKKFSDAYNVDLDLNDKERIVVFDPNETLEDLERSILLGYTEFGNKDDMNQAQKEALAEIVEMLNNPLKHRKLWLIDIIDKFNLDEEENQEHNKVVLNESVYIEIPISAYEILNPSEHETPQEGAEQNTTAGTEKKTGVKMNSKQAEINEKINRKQHAIARNPQLRNENRQNFVKKDMKYNTPEDKRFGLVPSEFENQIMRHFIYEKCGGYQSHIDDLISKHLKITKKELSKMSTTLIVADDEVWGIIMRYWMKDQIKSGHSLSIDEKNLNASGALYLYLRDACEMPDVVTFEKELNEKYDKSLKRDQEKLKELKKQFKQAEAYTEDEPEEEEIPEEDFDELEEELMEDQDE